MSSKQSSGTGFDKANIKPLSSVPLQTFLYFDHIYMWVYFFAEIFLFMYQGYGLFYPPSYLGIQIFILFGFWYAQLTRVFLGTNGNQTESSSYMLWYLIVTVLAGLCFLFFMRVQTYVLMIEQILGAIGVIFLILQFIFGIMAYSQFQSFEQTQ